MLVVFPYNTDSPLYHRPMMTIALIVINIYAYLLFVFSPPFPEHLMYLEYGSGIHPLQWVTSLFMHQDIFHVLGNMIFLWAFGLIVEGKIGWWRFAILYLGLGIFGSALEQIYMQNAALGYALGASGAIYSILAVALIWAPRNEIYCYFIFFMRISEFQIKLTMFSSIYIGLDVIMLWLNDFQMSGAFSHLLGALLGLIIGTLMLKMNWVDCEGWDFFSVWRNDRSVDPSPEEENTAAHNPTQANQLDSDKFNFLLENLRKQIKLQNIDDAKNTFHLINTQYRKKILPVRELLEYSMLLEKNQQINDAIKAYQILLRNYPNKTSKVRVLLAELLVKQERPSQALAIVNKIDESELSTNWNSRKLKITSAAKKMESSGDFLELDEDDW